MRAAAVLIALTFTPALVAQTVAAVDGNILFVDAAGRTTFITSNHTDSDPSLSIDHREIVFVRSTPNRKADTGVGDVEVTELWIAQANQKEPPRCVLVGHPGGFEPGPNMVMAGFSKPQFSPDGERVYFMAETWATSGAIHVLDLKAGKTRFLYPGLDVEVIRSGKFKGFLIGTKDPVTEGRGRITVYWLLDPDGKEVRRIGETEADVARFRMSM